MKTFFILLKQAFTEWKNDKVSVWSAALSYYTVFSLSPLLLLIVSIAGFFWGREALEGDMLAQLQSLLGKDAAATIQTMLAKSSDQSTNITTSIISFLTLAFGATGVVNQLKEAMNFIFSVEAKENAGLKKLVKDRFIGFSLLATLAFLLLVSLAASALIASFTQVISNVLPFNAYLLEILNVMVSVTFITIIFTIIFTILPDVHIPRLAAFKGAILTSILFTLGKTVIGLYIGNSAVSSTYGAAASLAIILLWVFYATQILFFGAEFVKVTTRKTLGSIIPSASARKIEKSLKAIPEPPEDKIGEAVYYFLSGFISKTKQKRKGSKR